MTRSVIILISASWSTAPLPFDEPVCTSVNANGTCANGVPNPRAGDLGPEGLAFVPAVDSPNGRPLLIVGNEISGSTRIYEIVAKPAD